MCGCSLSETMLREGGEGGLVKHNLVLNGLNGCHLCRLVFI